MNLKIISLLNWLSGGFAAAMTLNLILCLNNGFAIDVTPLPEREPQHSTQRLKAQKNREKNSHYIKLSPFHVPIIRDNHLVAYMGMQIILHASNKQAAILLETQLPRVHDLIYTDVYGICNVLWGTGYNPTLSSFKKRIERVCETYWKANLVKNVLIQNLYVHRR